MTGLALGLILLGALCHASWNVILKRAGGGSAFMWLFSLLAAVIYAPLAVAIIVVERPVLGVMQWLFIAGSALLHTAYYILLGRGYRSGDLSLVYPLARGTAPVLSMIAAIVLLAERPSAMAVAGALAIGAGAFLLTGDPRRLRAAGIHQAVGYALLASTMIAGYTIWDKQAVAVWLIPPLLLDWASNVGRLVLLSPLIVSQRTQLWDEWKLRWRPALLIAVINPLSYILALSAMVFTPVSYVAPAREISILFASLMGMHLLAEGFSARRLAAAATMVAGVVALALG